MFNHICCIRLKYIEVRYIPLHVTCLCMCMLVMVCMSACVLSCMRVCAHACLRGLCMYQCVWWMGCRCGCGCHCGVYTGHCVCKDNISDIDFGQDWNNKYLNARTLLMQRLTRENWRSKNIYLLICILSTFKLRD